MSAAQPRDFSELTRLQISHAQRPSGGGRGWVALGLILLIVLAASAGGAYWYYTTTGINIVAALSEKPVEVTLLRIPQTRAGAAAQQVLLVANGKIVSDREVNVATKVSGQITELYVEQGDYVQENQVLARVEDVVYRAQRDEAAATVERRKIAIEHAKVEWQRTQAAVLQTRADLDFEQRNYERMKQLFEIGQASELEYLNSRSRFESATAARDVAAAAAHAAEVFITAAESELAAAEATLRLLQKRLDDCAILAPIEGVILERNAQVGDFVAAEGGRGANANAQLVRIANMKLLRVEVDISERDISRLKPDTPARITPDADRGDVFDGHVLWIDPLGDYAKATVQVKVRIENPGPNLRVGGSAKVEFLAPKPEQPVSSAPASTWLPKEAVKLDMNDTAVGTLFTVVAQKAVANTVRIGARTDKNVEVLSGAYPGMEVIASGVEDVRDGGPVKVLRTVDEL